MFPGLEEFHTDKSKCQEHFDVYKECKKKEVPEISALMFIVHCILWKWCMDPTSQDKVD